MAHKVREQTHTQYTQIVDHEITKITALVASGIVSGDCSVCVSEWLKYLAYQKLFSDNTIRAYTGDLLCFFTFMSCKFETAITLNLIQKITVNDFRAWLSARKQRNVQSRSNARAMSMIRGLFKYTKREMQIENAAATAIRIINKSKRLPRSIPENTVMFAVEAARTYNETRDKWLNLRDSTALLLMYGCGLRIGEVTQLMFRDFYSTNDKIVVTVHGKGNKDRILAVLPETYNAILAYVDACPYDTKNGYLFVGIRGGKLNSDVLRAHIRRFRTSLGLPSYISPHVFRHSFATHLLDKGADIRSVQELLGHDSIVSTQLYTSVSVDRLVSEYTKYHPRCNTTQADDTNSIEVVKKNE